MVCIKDLTDTIHEDLEGPNGLNRLDDVRKSIDILLARLRAKMASGANSDDFRRLQMINAAAMQSIQILDELRQRQVMQPKVVNYGRRHKWN